ALGVGAVDRAVAVVVGSVGAGGLARGARGWRWRRHHPAAALLAGRAVAVAAVHDRVAVVVLAVGAEDSELDLAAAPRRPERQRLALARAPLRELAVLHARLRAVGATAHSALGGIAGEARLGRAERAWAVFIGAPVGIVVEPVVADLVS